MPFGSKDARDSRGSRGPDSRESRGKNLEYAEPLLRLGSMWNSKSGKAMTGNINLDYAKEGESSIGDQLMSLIERAQREERQLRFLVFENNGKFQSKAPFSLHVTLSELREEPHQRWESRELGESREDAPQAPRRWGPPVEDSRDSRSDSRADDSNDSRADSDVRTGSRTVPRRESRPESRTDDVDSDRVIEPTPRPMRRTAPRR